MSFKTHIGEKNNELTYETSSYIETLKKQQRTEINIPDDEISKLEVSDPYFGNTWKVALDSGKALQNLDDADERIQNLRVEMKLKFKRFRDVLKTLENDILRANEQFTSRHDKRKDTLLSFFSQVTKFTEMFLAKYEEKVLSVLNTFRLERKIFLTKIRSKVTSTLEELNKSLKSQATKRTEFMQAEYKEIGEVVAIADEEYHELTNTLENALKELQRTLLTVKTVVLLKTEKLDYNYRILSDREEENAKLLNAQKRKLTRLKDTLSRSIINFNNLNLRYVTRTSNLSDEYKTLSSQQKTLRERIKHFRRRDEIYNADLRYLQKYKEFKATKDLAFIEGRLAQLGILPHDRSYATELKATFKVEKEENNQPLHPSVNSENIEEVLKLIEGTMKEFVKEEENFLEILGFEDSNNAEFLALIRSLNLRPAASTDREAILSSLVEHFTKKAKLQSVISLEGNQSSSTKSQVSENERFNNWKDLYLKVNRRFSIFQQLEKLNKQNDKIERENEQLEAEIEKRLADPDVRKLLVPPAQALA